MNGTTTTPYSGGSNPENQALARRRIEAFVREPARDGNNLVTLPDQTTDLKTRRRDSKKRMEGTVETFEQQFNQ
ncbi:hypothetical protein VP1G_10520 [Cytospora mali]|uniref:Uncharacterized protein n=1 Tax=Cytospora mali TaxID=578113 RepID=A0A194UNE6_CYTMA|nr:hypothetical protein VP1G_10520 [Valsa mali var. pyri (nom. inval.)]